MLRVAFSISEWIPVAIGKYRSFAAPDRVTARVTTDPASSTPTFGSRNCACVFVQIVGSIVWVEMVMLSGARLGFVLRMLGKDIVYWAC